jgi:hypothetical protein
MWISLYRRIWYTPPDRSVSSLAVDVMQPNADAAVNLPFRHMLAAESEIPQHSYGCFDPFALCLSIGQVVGVLRMHRKAIVRAFDYEVR